VTQKIVFHRKKDTLTVDVEITINLQRRLEMSVLLMSMRKKIHWEI